LNDARPGGDARTGPPRLARWFLERALPAHLRSDTTGDRDEEYRARIAVGPGDPATLASARRWYRSQVHRSIGPALACRLRGRRTGVSRVGPWRSSEPFADFARSVRMAARSLARTPRFTSLTLRMLVIGIGASAAAFSVIDAVLLRPLPYPGAERIVYLYGSEIEKDNLDELEGTFTSFSRVAVHGLVDVDVEYGDGVARAVAMPVSVHFFPILGAAPAHGRPLAAADHAPGAEPVVLVNHRLAVRRFGDAGRVVGQTLAIDGRAFTVIGVMPAGFTYVTSGFRPCTRRTVPAA
jgi:hypothetical protein